MKFTKTDADGLSIARKPGLASAKPPAHLTNPIARAGGRLIWRGRGENLHMRPLRHNPAAHGTLPGLPDSVACNVLRMLRDLVAGQGCSAGAPGAGNALQDLSSALLHGQQAKGLDAASTSLQTGDLRLSRTQAEAIRARTGVMTRHLASDVGSTSQASAPPLPPSRPEDEARYSAFAGQASSQGTETAVHDGPVAG